LGVLPRLPSPDGIDLRQKKRKKPVECTGDPNFFPSVTAKKKKKEG